MEIRKIGNHLTRESIDIEVLLNINLDEVESVILHSVKESGANRDRFLSKIEIPIDSLYALMGLLHDAQMEIYKIKQESLDQCPCPL